MQQAHAERAGEAGQHEFYRRCGCASRARRSCPRAMTLAGRWCAATSWIVATVDFGRLYRVARSLAFNITRAKCEHGRSSRLFGANGWLVRQDFRPGVEDLQGNRLLRRETGLPGKLLGRQTWPLSGRPSHGKTSGLHRQPRHRFRGATICALSAKSAPAPSMTLWASSGSSSIIGSCSSSGMSENFGRKTQDMDCTLIGKRPRSRSFKRQCLLSTVDRTSALQGVEQILKSTTLFEKMPILKHLTHRTILDATL